MARNGKVFVKEFNLVDKLIDPRDLEYRINKKIRDIITDTFEIGENETELKRLNKLMEIEESKKNTFTYDNMEDLHKCLQRLNSDYVYHFHDLMAQTTVIVPSPRKNADLETRLKILRKRAADREYQEMAKGIKLIASNNPKGHKISEAKRTKTLLTALINGFLVVICSFFFTYKATEYTLSESDQTVQVLVATLATCIVAIAELYFFIRVM